MASLSPSLNRPIRGLDSVALDALVDALGEGAISIDARREALARFEALPPPAVQPGRYWKIDLAKQTYSDVVPFATSSGEARAEIAGLEPAWTFLQIDSDATSRSHPPAAGLKLGVWSFADIMEEGDPEIRAIFERALRSTLDVERDKFASLTIAFQSGGAFVYIPSGVKIQQPIVLTYVARRAAIFPYTLVFAGDGAECAVVERIILEGAAPFACGVAEVIVAPRARVAITSIVEPGAGRIFTTRRAKVDGDARIGWSIAELGGDLIVDSLQLKLEERGATGEIGGLFFADGTQHVALETQVDHIVGETDSQTIVKGAATGRGQGRYVGNIRIHPHAHKSDATLRDDSLLLSKSAHIDSIPALEIAANDVKAFHGATVGAIDETEIFYAQSRGISRSDAERMIALGFFEPAIAQFPHALRNHIRAALERKLPVNP